MISMESSYRLTPGAKVVRLKDVLGTAFGLKYQAKNALDALAQLPDGTVVDCAYFKFTSMGFYAGCIVPSMKRLFFTDSINAENRAKLEHNTRAEREEIPPLGIPLQTEFKNSKEATEYITSFNPNTQCHLPSRLQSQGRTFAIVSLLTMRYPTAVIDMGYHLENYFQFVRSNWYNVIPDRDDKEYQEALGTSVIKRSVRFGRIYVYGEGNIPVKDYVRNYLVLPSYFGSEVIRKNDRGGEFLLHYNMCVEEIKSFNISRRSLKSIMKGVGM